MDVRLKRAYEPAAASDGYRVLIDRLWPRGISRDAAPLRPPEQLDHLRIEVAGCSSSSTGLVVVE